MNKHIAENQKVITSYQKSSKRYHRFSAALEPDSPKSIYSKPITRGSGAAFLIAFRAIVRWIIR